MPRQKKVQKFDFSGFKRWDQPVMAVKELFSNDKDVISAVRKYIDDSTAVNKEVDYWVRHNIDFAEKVGNFDNLREWQVTGMISPLYRDPKSQYRIEVDKKFFAWYDNHEGAQEVYKAVTKEAYCYYKPDDSYEYDLKNAPEGWRDRPECAYQFAKYVGTHEGRTYIEKNREQKFEEGDLVVLRKPFVGNYDYDPHYRNDTMKPDDLRYGTVMAANTGEIHHHSRGGKGSRNINVMWFGKGGNIVAVPERVLKWESRKRTT